MALLCEDANCAWKHNRSEGSGGCCCRHIGRTGARFTTGVTEPSWFIPIAAVDNAAPASTLPSPGPGPGPENPLREQKREETTNNARSELICTHK